MRFIQTSDWQIGMKGGGLGEAGPLVREARVESIRNIFNAAQQHNADFMLLCGDIFEHNMVSQEYVNRVVSIFNEFPGIPLYLLPGNHDITGPGSVYNRPVFREVSHLTILQKSQPVKAGKAVIHPCPLKSGTFHRDPCDAIPKVDTSPDINIGVGHGSLLGNLPVSSREEADLPIDPSCIERTGIDYLALGHWHSHRAFPDQTGTLRIAYSGTHEQTGYNEDDAGLCLLVEMDKKGAAPSITKVPTGKLRWLSTRFNMRDSSSLNELKEYLDTKKDTDLLQLTLTGELCLKDKEELDNMLNYRTTLHKNFRAKLDRLRITLPLDNQEAEHDMGDMALNNTWKRLKDLHKTREEAREKEVITEALSHLYRLAKEAGR